MSPQGTPTRHMALSMIAALATLHGNRRPHDLAQAIMAGTANNRVKVEDSTGDDVYCTPAQLLKAEKGYDISNRTDRYGDFISAKDAEVVFRVEAVDVEGYELDDLMLTAKEHSAALKRQPVRGFRAKWGEREVLGEIDGKTARIIIGCQNKTLAEWASAPPSYDAASGLYIQYDTAEAQRRITDRLVVVAAFKLGVPVPADVVKRLGINAKKKPAAKKRTAKKAARRSRSR